jgi:hypothetical protein
MTNITLHAYSYKNHCYIFLTIVSEIYLDIFPIKIVCSFAQEVLHIDRFSIYIENTWLTHNINMQNAICREDFFYTKHPNWFPIFC